VIRLVTIAQIAAEANVSNALVSRVLNNKPGVSPENRAKILAIIEKHGYVPNAIARSLVTQKTHTIGVVMDSLSDTFFFDLICGMQNAAEEMDYNIIFCSGSNDSNIKLKYVDYFVQGRSDGVIAYGSRSQELFYEIINKARHFVIVEGDVPDKIFNKVQVNNFNGSYRATKHLIDLGYKNIVHFTGNMDHTVSGDRLEGFKKAMRDHSLPLDDAVVKADFSEQTAYDLMKKMIAQNKVPEALFAGADKSAYGILRAFFEHGLAAPRDMALIGFDGDIPDSSDILYPKLTTMRQPLFEMGESAVHLLIRSIENPDKLPETIIFDAEFIQGETCN